MIITLVSESLNHHQLMLSNALKKRCDTFYYLSTAPMGRHRKALGYKNLDYECDFVLRTYDGSTEKDEILRVLKDSDIVIFGSCPNSFIEYRMSFDKLSFMFSERFFKKGVWRRFIPKTRKSIENRIVKFKDKKIYPLCASAFLSYDLSLLGFPADKCYKWGYFPLVDYYDAYPERNNEKLRILWAGRMIDWKRADTVLKACHSLHKKGVDFQLDFIGDGICKDKLQDLCKKLKLNDKVCFLGSMPPEKVREKMLSADIFLFTSNLREGWGAVLNEAMSCGCAVIASSAAGAVPYLINDNENGLIYKYNSQKDLNNKLRILADNKDLRKTLGKNAIDLINNCYSAEIAAQRFVEFVENYDKKLPEYDDGPMSKAKIIKNNWYKK